MVCLTFSMVFFHLFFGFPVFSFSCVFLFVVFQCVLCVGVFLFSGVFYGFPTASLSFPGFVWLFNAPGAFLGFSLGFLAL